MNCRSYAATQRWRAGLRERLAEDREYLRFEAFCRDYEVIDGDTSRPEVWDIRAVERFLTTTLGMGDALQKIFPVVGAIAFAGALVEAGKKIYDLYEKWSPVYQG